MTKTKRLQIRLSEQEEQIIKIAFKNENISELIRDFLKSEIQKRMTSNKELEKEIKEAMYSDFFNSK